MRGIDSLDIGINVEKKKKAVKSSTFSRVALGGIILLSIILALVNLRAIGMGNEYYAAAVKSMLMSWKNFFFVAAEPGGSISVDKPPLGLWLQAFSALIFGINGLALALPQMITGIFSVPLLYYLIRRVYGTGAGLLAALILAVTPVSVAVMRVNMIDSELVFVLLLAAWAFTKAAEEGRLGWLLLGGLLVGLGFNFKMLEAYLPLPAFIAAYALGSADRWRKKIVNLLLTGILILVVSFSWAAVVDLTPASQRPYVGSTDHNSEILLSLGYNGLSRLVGTSGPDVGKTGLTRLLRNPLASETGWVLPVGLVAFLLMGIWLVRQKYTELRSKAIHREGARFLTPMSRQQVGAILWGGWFLIGFLFFSLASYIHGYYLHTLAPSLAAVIAIAVAETNQAGFPRKAWLPFGVLGALVFAYQIWIASQYALSLLAILLVAVIAVLGLFLLFRPGWLQVLLSFGQPAARLSAGMIILLAFPLAWSVLTVSDPHPDTILPAAYGPSQGAQRDSWPRVSQVFLSYLQARTQGVQYLVAVPNAVVGSPYVIASGRPVLYIGGFEGTDPATPPNFLANLVRTGRLRYVWDLGDLSFQQKAISQWLVSSCQVVKDAPLPDPQSLGVPGGPVLPAPPGGQPAVFHQTLYLCNTKMGQGK